MRIVHTKTNDYYHSSDCGCYACLPVCAQTSKKVIVWHSPSCVCLFCLKSDLHAQAVISFIPCVRFSEYYIEFETDYII